MTDRSEEDPTRRSLLGLEQLVYNEAWVHAADALLAAGIVVFARAGSCACGHRRWMSGRSSRALTSRVRSHVGTRGSPWNWSRRNGGPCGRRLPRYLAATGPARRNAY
jgi:hypothetical protein